MGSVAATGESMQETSSPQPADGTFEALHSLLLWRPAKAGHWPGLEMCVTTRAGGTSPPPFAALNLGVGTGDAPANVEANRARLRQHLGLGNYDWQRLRQVHGAQVLRAPGAEEREADGLWTDRPGCVLVVGVADCVPVFIWDARRRCIALLHAGWRGTAADIVCRGLDAMQQAGSLPHDLWLAMGPSIGPCCYAVGPEVAARFPDAIVADATAVHLDLRRANGLRARAWGVPAPQVAANPPCTACDSARFYSHRKLGPRTGRHWALAWMAT